MGQAEQAWTWYSVLYTEGTAQIVVFVYFL